jgi:CheY-like chemotaxis protein
MNAETPFATRMEEAHLERRFRNAPTFSSSTTAPTSASSSARSSRSWTRTSSPSSSGEEALRWLLDNECAVILLDVNMPGMDGLETAELIRSRRKSAHTPIIFITAFADEMHTARGYSLGAVDYILSPVCRTCCAAR